MAQESRDTRTHGDLGSMLGTFIYLLIGPIVWAFHLAAIYGSQLLCAVSQSGLFGTRLISSIVIAATVAALAPLAAAAWRPRAMARLLRVCTRSDKEIRFLDRVMRLLVTLAVAGIAWAGATALVIPPCAQLR